MSRERTKQSAKRRARVCATLRLVADNQPITTKALRAIDKCVTRYGLACWIDQDDDGGWSLTPEGQAVLAKHEGRSASCPT